MLCKYYFGDVGRYGCQAGDACKFSHVKPTMQSVSGFGMSKAQQQNQVVRSVVSKTVAESQGAATIQTMCRFVASKTACKAGDLCPFMHSNYEADERARRERGRKRREADEKEREREAGVENEMAELGARMVCSVIENDDDMGDAGAGAGADAGAGAVLVLVLVLVQVLMITLTLTLILVGLCQARTVGSCSFTVHRVLH